MLSPVPGGSWPWRPRSKPAMGCGCSGSASSPSMGRSRVPAVRRAVAKSVPIASARAIRLAACSMLPASRAVSARSTIMRILRRRVPPSKLEPRARFCRSSASVMPRWMRRPTSLACCWRWACASGDCSAACCSLWARCSACCAACVWPSGSAPCAAASSRALAASAAGSACGAGCGRPATAPMPPPMTPPIRPSDRPAAATPSMGLRSGSAPISATPVLMAYCPMPPWPVSAVPCTNAC